MSAPISIATLDGHFKYLQFDTLSWLYLGKGGVGKSTAATDLALGLKHTGKIIGC